jgi:hypothetical protein
MSQLGRVVVGLALGLTASVVQAETVDLFCQVSGATGASGLYVSIDMAASTAAVWGTGTSRQNAEVSPATITDDLVTWGPMVVNAPKYHLDRRSGLLESYSPNQMGGPFAVATDWNCKKDTPVF